MSLANIRVVLVRPTHPGNIGATARAMKNMSLSCLFIVAPECHLGAEAAARAAGADDILAQAVVCDTLNDALADCHTVIGTSARSRRIEWPELDPSAGAQRLVEGAQYGPVAVLFGQERTGLTNAELDCCTALVKIPANENFPSLNVASAVQILAYEILCTSHIEKVGPNWRTVPATREQLVGFYRHLERVLVEIEFLEPANPRLLMRRIIRLFNRAHLDDNEINILRGILTAVQTQRKLDNKSGE